VQGEKQLLFAQDARKKPALDHGDLPLLQIAYHHARLQLMITNNSELSLKKRFDRLSPNGKQYIQQ